MLYQRKHLGLWFGLDLSAGMPALGYRSLLLQSDPALGDSMVDACVHSASTYSQSPDLIRCFQNMPTLHPRPGNCESPSLTPNTLKHAQAGM